MKNINWILFLLGIGLWSCEETIELDLDQAPELIVIEGRVTDELKEHRVIVRTTRPYYAEDDVPFVSGANVVVKGSDGAVFSFEEIEAGRYQAKTAFAGQTGVTYTLEVETGGKLFTASDELLSVAAIDSLAYQINESEQADPEDPGRFYEVLLYIKEPQDTKDYYLFEFLRNDSIQNENGQEVYFSNDVAIGEAINGLPAPGFYAVGDRAGVKIHAISSEAYRFYLDLSNNLNNDGGMFSAPPANVSTNLSGGAIGYFLVSGVASAEIGVGE